MRALDNLLRQARLLRIARAERVQGEIAAAKSRGRANSPVKSPGKLQGKSPVTSPALDWMDECAAAQMILAALADPHVPTGDPRRTRALGVLDLTPAAPFVARAVVVLDALIEEMRPQDAVFAAMWPRVCDHVAPVAAPEPAAFDAGRARRSATTDVAQLAVESLLFEVIRGTIRAADARRATAWRPDLGAVVVEDGRVRRTAKPKADIEARRRATRATLGSPVAALAAVPPAKRGAGRRKTRAEVKAERRHRVAAERRAGIDALARAAAESSAEFSSAESTLLEVGSLEAGSLEVEVLEVGSHDAGSADTGLEAAE